MQRIGHRDAWVAVALAACGLATPHIALAAGAAAVAPRVSNVTPDSQPGWLPSADLERQARRTAIAYLAATDSGRYADAYAFIAVVSGPHETLGAFSERLREFNALAGPVEERRLVTLTWTANSAQAPFPGIYVAIDLVSRFANVDRHCGYLVLYQTPAGGEFKIMREENNYLPNQTAAAIARQGSGPSIDAMWAQLSAHCPGYSSSSSQPTPTPRPAPLPEVSKTDIGYPTVTAALAGLHAKPGVVFTAKGGWTIATDAADNTIWSFPPPGRPAYPAAVKRQVVSQAGGVGLRMDVLCGASKAACDDLVRAFQQLNSQLAAGMHARQ
jgi:hypothetical protein